MEFLTQELLWWHWVAFGIVLIVAEIIVPQFVVIWFGISALVVGVVKYLFLTTFSTNLAIWIILSLALLYIWFTFFRDKKEEASGQPEFGLDTTGVVIEPIQKGYKGKVHFQKPVLGSSDWQASSLEDIEVGENVKIVEVKGQLIEVRKIGEKS